LEKSQYSLADYYFNKALEIRDKSNDKRGVAQCFNNIAKNAVRQKNYETAQRYYDKALNLGREIGNKESILNSLQSLSTLYHETKNDHKAYLTFMEFTTLKDSLYNVQNLNRIAQIEMKYKFDQQQNLFDMELKKRENERQKAELTYLIIGGSLFFLLLISVLLIFLQRSKIRNDRLLNDKLELEHRNTLLEKQKLKEDLDFKNRELTTNVMYLLKKNELITGISEKLIKAKPYFKTENQIIISEIIQ
jgi:tetratricopeptide (TPR) repeat protein